MNVYSAEFIAEIIATWREGGTVTESEYQHIIVPAGLA